MTQLLAMHGVSKSYPGVRAVHDVSLDLNSGEVLALLGENGAGKSTLIKILGGAVAPDRGRILVDGREIEPGDLTASRAAGIAVIFQEFNLVPALTAAENIFLGREPSVGGWIRRGDERRRARDLFARLGVAIDPDSPCRELSTAQQQIVEIAKALSIDARILVMDEPTAALTPTEAERLFAVVRELTRQGLGVVYISHRLDEIDELADRITVLRDGEHVHTGPAEELNRQRLIELMVGRRMDQEFPARQAAIGEPRLVVRGLRRGHSVRDVSFEVRRGEVLAIAGLVGSGRTETLRLIFGADRRDAGEIELDGKALDIRGPRDAIRAGIALLTEDRKTQGLVLAHSVRDNFALPNLRDWSTLSFIQHLKERTVFNRYISDIRIKTADANESVRNLSGGNQQKVVLAKWLQRRCEVVLVDEPTRGIDVGAKFEIYQLINDLARQGKAVVMVSSELPEVLGMADRILVMHEGRVTGEIADAKTATSEAVARLAVG